MTTTTRTDGVDQASALRAAEAARIALATELDFTRRQLWRERVLRQFPQIARAVDLIPDVPDEEAYLSLASLLSEHIT